MLGVEHRINDVTVFETNVRARLEALISTSEPGINANRPTGIPFKRVDPKPS